MLKTKGVNIKPKDLIGLKLPQALAVLYDCDRPIKIGSEDGTAFFYAGSVQGAAATIDQISVEQYKRFEMLKNKAQTALTRAAYDFPHMTEKTKGTEIGEMVYRIKSYGEKLGTTEKYLNFLVEAGKYADNVLHMRRYARAAKENFDTYVSMREREVKKAFYADPAADEARPLVIIVDGREVGAYWTIEEARKNEV